MKRALLSIVLVSFFIGATALVSLAASEHESHHPDDMQAPAATTTTGMSNMMGSGMDHMMGSGMNHMMGSGMNHMMGHGPDHMLFLDHVEEIGLSAEQVSKLKTLALECRKDNIRNAAEAKIANLELANLLSDSNWSLKDAEALVRKAQKLEGDVQVRHLKAVRDARNVLTVEQLEKAGNINKSDNLESLFE